MDITSRSKILDVLNEYPFLEDKIIAVAPPFKNLKNPVLRRTVGRVATLEQVAQIGQLDVGQFVNALRRAAGQAESLPPAAARPLSLAAVRSAEAPAWIAGEPQHIIDGIAMLGRGDVPLITVNELLGTLAADRYLLLITDFPPLPIIDAMRKQDRQVYHTVHPDDPSQHLTFIH